ncbi:hypothetical protein pdam_00017999, partial [Pocillopora damicornis]
MDRDLATRKRKKSIEDVARNAKKSLKNGSGSDEEDEELFSWEEYLKKYHAKAVPKETFKHVQDTKVQGFVPGMKLESMDRTSLEADTYWVATVVMASGPLLLLRYDGYDDDRSGDFWCDAASDDLQPVGWCARNNHILIPPAGYLVHPFNWQTYLEHTNSTAAADSLFTLAVPPHEFDIGMKLEAVDQTDPSTITVASVSQVVGRTMWRSNPDEENQLKPGLKLEVLHKNDPLSYWVASVVDSYGLRLRLRLEGSEDEANDVWVYFLSDTVHQLGWGKKKKLRLNIPPDLKTRYPSKDWAQIRGRLLGICNMTSNDMSLNEALNKENLPCRVVCTEQHSTYSTPSVIQRDTNHLQNANMTSINTENEAKMDFSSHTDKTESCSLEEIKTKSQEKQSPISSKGKYDLRPSTLVPRGYGGEKEEESAEKKKVEAVIDLTEDDEVEVEARESKPVETKAGLPSKDDSRICIYVKKSCEPGPFLKQAKVASLPAVIGPAGPNIVLRQLVEQIVLSAHSSKQVLKLLASETDKMTISSILKTLKNKLSLCENLTSLNKDALCAHCDAQKVPLSPPASSLRKNYESPTTPSPATSPLNETPSPIRKAVPKVDSHLVGYPAGNPAGQPAKSLPVLKIALPKAKNIPKAAPFSPPPRPEPSGSSSISGSRSSKHVSQWSVQDVVDFIRITDCFKFADEFQRQ